MRTLALRRFGAAVCLTLLFSPPALARGKRSAPVKEPAPPSLPVPAAEPPAPAPSPRPAPRPEPSPAAVTQSAPPTEPRGLIDRLGASVDLSGESSRMSGEQWINNFRADESFDYGRTTLGATLYALFRPIGHFRFGPGLRFLGNYGSEDFTFGYLGEAHVQGDFSLRAFEQVDVLFGAKVGASLLFPGEDFKDEIRRLQAQSADVWSVPRVGWVGGLSVGARRKIAGNFYARFDISGQLGHHFLFSTDQIVDGLRFRKFWGNDIRRLGATLGFEVAL